MASREGSGRRRAGLAAAVVLAGGLTLAGGDGPGSGVTVDRGSGVPQTRQQLVAAWRAEAEEAGKGLPSGWEDLSTEQIRERYLDQWARNGAQSTGDPGMAVDPCDSWTALFRPARCW